MRKTDGTQAVDALRKVRRQNDSDQSLAVGSGGKLTLYKSGLSYVSQRRYTEDYAYSVTLDDDGRVVSAAPGRLTRLR